MKIEQYVEEVRSGRFSVEDKIAKVHEEIRKINKEDHYFITISEEESIKEARDIDKRIKKGDTKGDLLGLPISIKDCLSVQGIETKNSSKILQGYKPLYDATAVQKAKEAGAIILGKTVNDAWGFGSFNVNVGLGIKIPKNPLDPERVTGGSSGGAAGITKKATFTTGAIAESTGGSIACPAAFCGVVGLTPTYGLVSRWGQIDYANSLDKIGPVTKNVADAELMLKVIAGHDEKDSTSLKQQNQQQEKKEKYKVGIVKEALGKGLDPEIEKATWKAIKKLESEGTTYEEISLPVTYRYGIATYYLLAMSEASTNLAKYCGIRYGMTEKLEGNYNEYFSKVRSEYFNEETKRRIIIGTFARMAGFRDAYYLKAAKVRTMIINEYQKSFKRVDALITPTMPVIAPKFEEIKLMTPLENYMMDILTVGPNLAGIPHISVPNGKVEGMPIGIMITADHLQEEKIITIGKRLE